ncbi:MULTISPECIES: hypothetical protein [unclassified Pseudomonas]|uniref:hypothetical protein n=1 Tax=unclassified Pseudomonas TaxID=196821 RepID=UPI0025D19DBB|nr:MULTISPECIES: hypothetical protein [unclassified Pseudomonas]
MKGYFPFFISGLLATVGSVMMTGILTTSAFYPDVPPDISRLWMERAVTVAIVFVCVCHVFVILGRPRWIWGIVLVLFSCLLTVLPTIEHRPHKVSYFLGVFCPILGLLVLNCAQYRELRKAVLRLRYQRNRFLAIRHARGRRRK